MKNILVVYGTRPEYLKVHSLIKAKSSLNIKSIHIQQHNDIINFGNPNFKLKLETLCNNRLNNIFSEILLKLGAFIDAFDAILIQGDTATVAASAICAFNYNKKIIYLESGLRSFDLQNPYPEEGYRQMVARIADINLCPTELSKLNLNSENIKSPVYVVGNTCLDNLIDFKTKTSYSNKVLVTLHRSENISIINQWFSEIDKIALLYQNLEFILPVHPNPEIITASKKLKHVKVTSSLQHVDLINILKDCKLVISDSGGIQEEASFLNKKIIVCRKTTERPEGIVSGHIYLCKYPEDLSGIFENLLNNYTINEKSPYGDGKSAKRIIEILENIQNTNVTQ